MRGMCKTVRCREGIVLPAASRSGPAGWVVRWRPTGWMPLMSTDTSIRFIPSSSPENYPCISYMGRHSHMVEGGECHACTSLANPSTNCNIQKRPEPQVCQKLAPAIAFEGSSQGTRIGQTCLKICPKIVGFFKF